MRITHNVMYNNMNYHMNRLLGENAKYNEQNATQKQINRPSDDPIGTVRILNYRASLATNSQQIDNSKEAASWVSSADSALQQAQTILSAVREKAVLAADGKMTAENRFQVAFELRELLGSLMNIANTSFNDQNLFGGHKTSEPPYSIALGATTEDKALRDGLVSVSGDTDRSIPLYFTNDGTVGTDTLTYRYSPDGGKTWKDGTITPPATTLDLPDADGVTVEMKAGTQVTAATLNDPDNPDVAGDGVLLIRPTAYYHGDDNDNPPQVDIHGNSAIDVSNTKATGSFSSNVRIRIEQDVDVTKAGTVNYSYTNDNGLTWKTGTANTVDGGSSVRLTVPGGYLDVTPEDAAAGAPAKEPILDGQEFVIRPHRAETPGIEIAPGDFITVTYSGKDIFGGLYVRKPGDPSTPADSTTINIFEEISDLIAYCEVNNQDGIGQSVEDLRVASEELLTNLAMVGGKETRVTLNINMLSSHHDDMTDRTSSIEDANIAELLLNLAQTKNTYESLLQSSSMLMNINLLKYL